MALGSHVLRAFVLLTINSLLPNEFYTHARILDLDQEPHERRVLDEIYTNGRKKTETTSLPFRRFVQLYSRNSGRHVRINADRSVDAKGENMDKFAKLVVESISFGRVRIRGTATDYFLCVDKKGRLRARARSKDNCVYTEHLANNAYTEFSSVKYNSSLVAFNRRGKPRRADRQGIKAVQFIERATNIRLYRGRKYKNNRKTIELYRRKQPYEKISVSMRRWKEFKRWRKLSKRTEKMEENSLTTTTLPRITTTLQIHRNTTAASVKVL